jgi:hypothetical protein
MLAHVWLESFGRPPRIAYERRPIIIVCIRSSNIAEQISIRTINGETTSRQLTAYS